jgi:hypothetical protein
MQKESFSTLPSPCGHVSGREMYRAYMFAHQAEDHDARTASGTGTDAVVTSSYGGCEFRGSLPRLIRQLRLVSISLHLLDPTRLCLLNVFATA